MAGIYAAELEAALTAVRDAARICQSVQSSISSEAMSKQDKSPVTVADFGSQAVVCRALAHDFPHDPIVAEEDSTELRVLENSAFLHRVHEEVCRQCIAASPDQICHWIDRGSSSDYQSRFWTLDPIDGTKGFLRKEQYAISLGLIVEGQVVLGVLGCPNLPPSLAAAADGAMSDPQQIGALYFAVRGGGAFVTSLSDPAAPRVPIHVSPNTDPAQARFCESVEAGHSAHDLGTQIRQRLGSSGSAVRLDSQAKYAVVARGEADVYLRLPTRADYREMIWDHAGGVIIVEEAGGKVTDVDGRPLEFTHGRRLEHNRGVIATNGPLHTTVLDAVAAVL